MERIQRDGRDTGLAAASRTIAATVLSTPQITVLDAGGQYCHLIATESSRPGRLCRSPAQRNAGGRTARPQGHHHFRRTRQRLRTRQSPHRPGDSSQGSAVLGICYGQQLMAHMLGGRVRKGEKGEYGLAQFEPVRPHPLFAGLERRRPGLDESSGPRRGRAAAVSTFWPARIPARSRPWRIGNARSSASSFIPKWCTHRTGTRFWRTSSSACAAAQGLGSEGSHSPARRGNPRGRRRPQCVLLRERRRRFHRRLHAVPARARARARLRHLCRHRA